MSINGQAELSWTVVIKVQEGFLFRLHKYLYILNTLNGCNFRGVQMLGRTKCQS